MKCIKNVDGEIRRVRDDQAIAHTKSGDWEYIPKAEWKASKAVAAKKKADKKKAEAAKKKAATKSAGNSKGQKKKGKRQFGRKNRQREASNGRL